MKIIVGCNGMKGGDMARAITNNIDPDEALQLARKESFGCEDDLVIVTPDKIFRNGKDVSDQPWEKFLYRSTFVWPDFNPRWTSGLCEKLWVVELEPTPHIVREQV